MYLPSSQCELLHHWRAVIGSSPKGFPRDFAPSIQKARKRPTWQPSERQLALMQRMVSELFTSRDDLPLFDGADDDLVLIERGWREKKARY